MKPVSALLYGLFVVVALQRTEHEVEAMKYGRVLFSEVY